jgi:hypothetical protein
MAGGHSMTIPIFHLDDEVEIIGVRCDGQAELTGNRFKISQYHADQDGERCSAIGFPWYPASSLRLVEEELKIGDYAEVILQGNTFTGKIGKVTDDSGIKTVALYNMGVWNRENLRKLSPEEIAHI